MYLNFESQSGRSKVICLLMLHLKETREMGDVKKLGLLLPLISGQKSRILNREKKGKCCGDAQGP